MPEHEREALLNRLKQSVRSETDEREAPLHREVDERERTQRIEKDLSRLSIFARLWLWLRSKFGGRSIKEAYVAMRLKALKRSIAGRFPGLTGFETRDLSPRFADEIFRIYSLTVPLKPLYRRVWTDPVDLQRMVVGVLESRIPDVKRSVTEVLPMERLEEIVRSTGSREALREEATRRLSDYIDGIPGSVFASVQEDIKPLERTRDIVLYPYTSFFQLFHFTPMEEDINKKTYFKSASVMLCLEHLEALHHALYSVTTIPSHYELPDDMLMYLSVAEEVEAERGLETEADEANGEVSQAEGRAPKLPLSDSVDEPVADGASEPPKAKSPEPVDEEYATARVDPKVKDLVTQLIDRSREAYKKLPFEALIRYFTKDPYYELVRTFQETPVKELYVSVLRLRFLAELDKLYPELRKRVVERDIRELFEGKTLRTFRNYREYQSIDYRKLGLPFFIHTRSVVLLFNYIHWFYRGYIQEVVQLLDKNVLSQNRITRDRLVQYAQTVEETAERIRQFDYSLSSDSEDGRMFQRLRFTLAQDSGHQKMYRSLVLQKDREVRTIIERGVDALNGLLRVFMDLMQSSSPTIRTAMQNHYFIKGRPTSLTEIVQERMDHIQNFLRLLDQVIKLERG